MPGPSKPWTDIPDSKVDAESPVTEETATNLRDNDVHTDERVGVPTNPGARTENHAHKGLDVDGSALVSIGSTINANFSNSGILLGVVTGTEWTLLQAAPAGATIAILNIRFENNGSNFLQWCKVRKAGLTANGHQFWSGPLNACSFQMMIPVDADGKIEVSTSHSSVSVAAVYRAGYLN